MTVWQVFAVLCFIAVASAAPQYLTRAAYTSAIPVATAALPLTYARAYVAPQTYAYAYPAYSYGTYGYNTLGYSHLL